MAARYSLRRYGVHDSVLGRVITRTDAEWSDYRVWLRDNTPDPEPAVAPADPTPAELAAQAELAEQAAIKASLRSDAAVRALASRSPAQVDAWIDANVTTLAEARSVLKILARILALLARQTLPPP
jgi:hypothetical protein